MRSIAGQAATVTGPAPRRAALRHQAGGGLRRGRRAARRERCLHADGDSARGGRPFRRPSAPSPEPAARRPLHSRIAEHPRRDHARSVRGSLRRRGRAAALFARSILHNRGRSASALLRSATVPWAHSPRGSCWPTSRSAAAPGAPCWSSVGNVRREQSSSSASLAVVSSCRSLRSAVSGFADMLSMNIRSTTRRPRDAQRAPRAASTRSKGVFISASNELGAFESGTAAALLGAVPAVVAGGAITIGLALV